MCEEVRGLRSTNKQLQNSHVDVKYSTGNEAAKELTCVTQGHEKWCGDLPKRVGCQMEEGKGGIRATVIALSIKNKRK